MFFFLYISLLVLFSVCLMCNKVFYLFSCSSYFSSWYR